MENKINKGYVTLEKEGTKRPVLVINNNLGNISSVTTIKLNVQKSINKSKKEL